MAVDKDDKTEEPTAKRQSDARNKGQVPNSMEVRNFAALLGFTVLIAIFAPILVQDLISDLQNILYNIHRIPSSDPNEIGAVFFTLMVSVFWLLLLPIFMMIVLAIVSSTFQFGFLFTTQTIKIDLNKLNPINGLKKYMSIKPFVELGKSIAKFVLITAVVAIILWPEFGKLENYVRSDLESTVEDLWIILIKMLVAILIIVAIIAVVDLIVVRKEHHDNLKMTRQEVKDERKQMEGNPEVKKRMAKLRFQRFRERMMQNVPKADVVVTNPTHYAVAMAYKPGEMSAPRLVAKGVDNVAYRIKEVAEEHDIPIVENAPVARALYASVDIDQEIPPEHYKAVAEIISYVFKLQRRRIPA